MLAVACDVSRPLDVISLADEAFARFGSVSFLMNNAGVDSNTGKPWENLAAFKGLIDVNFWGVVHGVCAFTERMLASGEPAIIVNTGSKQGITTPPGNLAYNVSKSALKTYTEGLAHALRNVARLKRVGASSDPGLHLYRPDQGRDREAAGRLDRRSGGVLHAGEPGAGRLLHPLPRQRHDSAKPTSGAWPGRSATSSRTGRRCRAGIRTTRTPSTRFLKQ